MSPRFVLAGTAALLLVFSAQAAAQTGTITGTVTDARSMAPVSAAQVHIPRLQFGSLTQSNGRYLLVNVPVGTHALQIDRIGYRSETREVTVVAGQPAEVNVSMTEDALALDEIVVTGTAGQARRREVGNQITQVRITEVAEPVANIGNLLQGRLAGVRILDGSGNAGSAPDIRLRGNVSVALSNQPLIYIDGVRAKSEPYPSAAGATGRGIGAGADMPGPLNDLNPDDIERVEIVKGPAATTLYGTEAAAGVIQIFTKSGGSTGAAVWTAETRQGFSYFRPFGPDVPPVPGSREALEPEKYGTSQFQYMDPIFRKGHRQSYNLSVRGGTADRLGYYLSGGYEDNQGASKNDYEQQLSIRGNQQFRAHEDLLVQFNNSYAGTKLSQNQHGNTTSGFVMTAYRGDDSYIGRRDVDALHTLLIPKNFIYTDRYVNGLTVNFTPATNFTHRLTLGHDFSSYDAERLTPYGWDIPVGRSSLGGVGRVSSENTLKSIDYVSTLSFDLLSSLKTSFSFGVQGVENQEETVWANGSDLPGPGDYTVSSSAQREGYQSKIRVITGGFFLQDMLSLADKYFLTLGMRVDGNSAFGSGFGLQPYPKASLAYVVSDEGFWPEALGSMKVRGAYGWAGRAPGAFDAVRTWEPIGWGLTTPAFQPQNLGNAELGPERTQELELGFDASVLGDRINIEYTHYARTTTDALFGVRRPDTEGGWSNQLENVGEFKAWGDELSINASVIARPSFSWDLGVGLATNFSEVVSLGSSPPQNNLIEGQPVPVVRGAKIMNFYEKAEPIVELNQIYGPASPTEILNLNTSITLPGGITLSGRGEYQGGYFISNGAESNALSRAIESVKCYRAYELNAAGQRAEMYAWERQQCFGMSPGTNIVPGDYFELRDLTASVPISRLLPGLTSWSTRTDLTISGRNVWFWKHKKLVVGHPEQQDRTGIGAAGFSLSRSIGETVPPQSTFTVSLRTIF